MSVTVTRPDRFPVGTVVGAYPAAGRHFSDKPTGTAVEEHTVGSDGKLAAFTTLTADTPYVLWGESGGVGRYLSIEDSAHVEPGTLKERIKARQEAAGV